MVRSIPTELLEEFSQKSIKICQELVRRPSEDLPGDTRIIAGYINDFFKSQGIESSLVAPHEEKPSVVATIKGSRPGRHVVFNGHIDTFPIGEKSNWSQDPFGAKIVDGKLFGRGSSDMKGGVAASMAAFSILNKMKNELSGTVSITCVSDEEVGGPWGTRYLLKNFPELYGDAMINGEPSSIEHIRIGEKGKYKVKIITSTKGGHGAYAGLRTNAIMKMMDILNNLRDFSHEAPEMDEDIKIVMEKCRQSYDSILGKGAMDVALSANMNVGTIHGGIMVNMIPEECVCELNFRLPPGLTDNFIRSWLDKKLMLFSDTTYDIYFSANSFLTSPSHPIVKIAKEEAALNYGKPVYENYSIGGTECYLWRSKGIPCVQYGPNHHNMGSPDEYIFANELPIVTKVHAMTAWRFLNDTI